MNEHDNHCYLSLFCHTLVATEMKCMTEPLDTLLDVDPICSWLLPALNLQTTFLTFFMVSDYACTRMDDENGWTGLGCRGCPCLPQHWGINPGLTLRYYSYQSNSGINPGLPQQIDINPRLTIILSSIFLSWYFFSFREKKLRSRFWWPPTQSMKTTMLQFLHAIKTTICALWLWKGYPFFTWSWSVRMVVNPKHWGNLILAY